MYLIYRNTPLAKKITCLRSGTLITIPTKKVNNLHSLARSNFDKNIGKVHCSSIFSQFMSRVLVRMRYVNKRRAMCIMRPNALEVKTTDNSKIPTDNDLTYKNSHTAKM